MGINYYSHVCFSGKMGSGKTTASEYLVNTYKYTRLSFAGALKEIVNYLEKCGSPFLTTCYTAWNFGGLDVFTFFTFWQVLRETQLIPPEFPKPRRRLQFLGNSIRDRISKNFWVDIIQRKLRASQFDPKIKFVIDDARYPNEVQLLRAYNFLDVFIVCKDTTRLSRLKALYGITDINDSRLYAESEVALDDFVFTVRLSNDLITHHSVPVVADFLNTIDDVLYTYKLI